jgi:uncharacterized protein
VDHEILRDLAICAAGLAAGTINAVVGSGTLITFPTLLAFGYPPVLANVSNNVGLVPGVLSGVHGYRRELVGQRSRILFLGSASLLGGILGAILLLTLPASAFKAIVPVLIGLAIVLVIVQPMMAGWVARRLKDRGDSVDATGGPVLWAAVFGTGVYGGYFGAAQGVLLIGLLGIALTDTLQRLNAVKNVLAAVVNGVAAVIFIAVTHVDWTVAALIAAGSVVGGQIGARVGRRLSPVALRILIVCVGIAALVKLLA